LNLGESEYKKRKEIIENKVGRGTSSKTKLAKNLHNSKLFTMKPSVGSGSNLQIEEKEKETFVDYPYRYSISDFAGKF